MFKSRLIKAALVIVLISLYAPFALFGATTAVQLNYANFGYSLLVSSVGNGTTTLTVSSGTGSSFPTGLFRAVIFSSSCASPAFCSKREFMNLQVTTPGADTFTIVLRGQEGTTATSWTSGDKIYQVVSAGEIQEIKDAYNGHIIDYNNPHQTTKALVGLGNVENTALSTWIGATSITTLGTILTGVWHGTPIDLSNYSSGAYIAGPTANGGLALTGSHGGTLGLIPCALNQTIMYNGSAWACANPSSSSSVVSNDTIWTSKGQLVAATGVGAATTVSVGTNYSVLYANSTVTNGISWLAPGTNGQALMMSGGALVWQTPAGAGTVTGPASSTTGFIPKWNNATGTALAAGVAAPTSTIAGVDDTQVFTHKTIDVDLVASANTLYTTVKSWLAAAGCNGSTPSTMWDLMSSASSGATPACVLSNANVVYGVLQFPKSGTIAAYNNFMLPDDFMATRGIDVSLKWFATAATTGYVVWDVDGYCVTANADDANIAFASVQTVISPASSTAGGFMTGALTSVSVGSCNAGDQLYLQIRRTSNDTSDTMNDTANLVGVQVTYRRAI